MEFYHSNMHNDKQSHLTILKSFDKPLDFPPF